MSPSLELDGNGCLGCMAPNSLSYTDLTPLRQTSGFEATPPASPVVESNLHIPNKPQVLALSLSPKTPPITTSNLPTPPESPRLEDDRWQLTRNRFLKEADLLMNERALNLWMIEQHLVFIQHEEIATRKLKDENNALKDENGSLKATSQAAQADGARTFKKAKKLKGGLVASIVINVLLLAALGACLVLAQAGRLPVCRSRQAPAAVVPGNTPTTIPAKITAAPVKSPKSHKGFKALKSKKNKS